MVKGHSRDLWEIHFDPKILFEESQKKSGNRRNGIYDKVDKRRYDIF